MKRQTLITRKKRGPPATGKGTLVGVRLQPADLNRLDAWSKAEHPQASRPEAIRRLMELALSVSGPPKQPNAKSVANASNMASTQLDNMIDSTLPDEERATRKRRLLHGPSGFRQGRLDMPKAE